MALSAEIISLISNVGRIEIRLILTAREHLPFILNKLENIRLVIIHMMKRSITWRRRWSGYVDIFFTKLE